MKRSSTFLYVLRLALTLLLITSVVAAALAVVDKITAPLIRQTSEQKLQQAIGTVLPGGGAAVPFNDDTGLVEAVYRSDAGFAVQVAPSGFAGKITMMVGMDPEGTLLGLQIISHTETVGLGAVAGSDTAKGQAFRDQFIGLRGLLAVTKDGGTVDSVTGATITSRAIADGVNAAVACVEAFGG